jgi:hypothetical protein
MFRSETILFYKLIIPATNSWEVMNSLGQLGCVHMKDMLEGSIVPERPFYNNLKHCDEVMESIKRIIHTLNERNEEITGYDDYNIFLRNLKMIVKRQGIKEK